MAEYIEREALLHEMKMDIRPPFAVVRDFPAADVAEVKHGKWIRMDSDNEAISKCSVCQFPVSTFWNESNYCPNCGAKMDGGGENENS